MSFTALKQGGRAVRVMLEASKEKIDTLLNAIRECRT